MINNMWLAMHEKNNTFGKSQWKHDDQVQFIHLSENEVDYLG